MSLSRRAFLFGVGATAVAVAASSPLFPAPTFQPSITDLRVGDKFTIAGVYAADKAGRALHHLQQFVVTAR